MRAACACLPLDSGLEPAGCPEPSVLAPKPTERRKRGTGKDALFHCQVAGCTGGQASDAPQQRRYYARYRLCPTHLHAEEVVVRRGALPSRFCQKCSSLHPLTAFDGKRRTCAAKLALERARRQMRSGQPGSGSGTREVTPSEGPSPGEGEGAPSALSVWQKAGVVFSDELAALAALEPAPAQAPSELAALAAAWCHKAAAAPAALLAGEGGGGSDDGPSAPYRLELRLKLHGAAPANLPLGLRDALMPLLGPEALGVHAAVEPGCTLLTLSAIVPGASTGLEGLRYDAAAAAKALTTGRAAAFFNCLPSWSLAAGGLACDVEGHNTRLRGPSTTVVPPRLPPAVPLAVCTATSTAVLLELPAGTAAAWAPRCRLHGQFLAVTLEATGRQVTPGAEEARLLFPACPQAVGCAVLSLVPRAPSHGTPLSAEPAPETALLLSPDANIVAEVLGAQGSPGAAELVTCLGYVLRREGATPPLLLRAAATACLARGWTAASAACLAAAAAAAEQAQAADGCEVPSVDGELLAMLLRAAACGAAPVPCTWLVLSAFPGAAHVAFLGRAAHPSSGSVAPVALLARFRGTEAAELTAAVRDDVAAAATRLADTWVDAVEALAARALPPRAPSLHRRGLAKALAVLGARGDVTAVALARVAATRFPPPAPWALRVPGAFADPVMERAWMAQVAATVRLHDWVCYPAAAAVHAAQMVAVYRRAGLLPTPPQLFYIVLLLLGWPLLLRLWGPAFGAHREGTHAAMRLIGSAFMPAWVTPGQSRPSAVHQGVFLFSMAFFSMSTALRTPLHLVVQALSFAISVGVHRITAQLPMRLGVAAVNLAIVNGLERASRRRFAARWAEKAHAA